MTTPESVSPEYQALLNEIIEYIEQVAESTRRLCTPEYVEQRLQETLAAVRDAGPAPGNPVRRREERALIPREDA